MGLVIRDYIKHIYLIINVNNISVVHNQARMFKTSFYKSTRSKSSCMVYSTYLKMQHTFHYIATYLSTYLFSCGHLALLLMAQDGASSGGGINDETSDCLTSLLFFDLGILLFSFVTSLSSSIMKIEQQYYN